MNVQVEAPVRYAGFWIRLLAFLIDMGVIFLLSALVLTLIGIDTTESSIWILAAAYGLLGAPAWLVWPLYEIGFVASRWQATPGKRLLGLRVCDRRLGRVSLLRATGRSVASTLSALILCIGYLIIAWTKNKQGLHDLLAGTLVVHVPAVQK